MDGVCSIEPMPGLLCAAQRHDFDRALLNARVRCYTYIDLICQVVQLLGRWVVEGCVGWNGYCGKYSRYRMKHAVFFLSVVCFFISVEKCVCVCVFFPGPTFPVGQVVSFFSKGALVLPRLFV